MAIVILAVTLSEESLLLKRNLIQFMDGKAIKPLISVVFCASYFLAENGFLMRNNRR